MHEIQSGEGLLSRYRRIMPQELIEPVPRYQIVKERVCRNSCSRKDRGSPE